MDTTNYKLDRWDIIFRISIIALIIPVAGFIFAAGSLYQKFRNMEHDLKSMKGQLNDIAAFIFALYVLSKKK